MPVTPSTMLDLGTTASSFRLPDFNSTSVSDQDFTNAAALLVAWKPGNEPEYFKG